MGRLALRIIVACALFIGVLRIACASNEELVFGIFPYLSPSQTVEQFTPLREHLSQALGQPVAMRSAPDYKSFIERTKNGEFDILLTAPHMGRVAEKRDGYRPIAQTGYQIVIVTLARTDSPIRSLADMRNYSLSIGARMSMTHQIMKEALHKKGLVLEKDVRFVETASFSNVVQAVIRGEANAGATGTLLWDTTPEEDKKQLRQIFRSSPVPGFLMLAHPRIGKADMHKLQQALLAFKNTPEANVFMKKTGYVDFRTVDKATMQRIDPYTTIILDQN